MATSIQSFQSIWSRAAKRKGGDAALEEQMPEIKTPAQLKKIPDDPEFDKQKAHYLLRQFVSHHEFTIAKKVAIMLAHFVDRSMHRIGGKAKGMIVTSSRRQTVRYKLAVDKYIEEHNLPFTLLSDEDHSMAEAYGAWGIKKNYGREYEGLIRSTIVVGADGAVEHAWYNVKAKGHVEKVAGKFR